MRTEPAATQPAVKEPSVYRLITASVSRSTATGLSILLVLGITLMAPSPLAIVNAKSMGKTLAAENVDNSAVDNSLVQVKPATTGAETAALPAGLEGLFERTDGGYFRLVDEKTGEEITITARILGTGDTYINEDNRRYEVTRIDGDTVYMKYTGTVTLPTAKGSRQDAGSASLWQRFTAWTGRLLGQAGTPGNPARVALYCTHSDESYVPTSGTASEEWGDVYQVGDALKRALEKRGYKVDYSKNNHNPHDSQAYIRSRRTAIELLKKRPAVMLDLHRDAVPGAKKYETYIRGESTAKVRLVVGRQNQNRQANLDFAQRIKAEADKQYPGLIKGIFHARGNYNQDLAPRSMLLEFGTYSNTQQMAEEAADLIAAVVPVAAGISSPGTAAGAARDTGPSALITVLWIVIIVVAVAIGAVLLNAEGWKGVKKFFSREFASTLSPKRNPQDENPEIKDGERETGPDSDSNR